MTATPEDALRFGGVNPIFRVGNLAASLDYYVKVLGFTIDWEYTGVVACVSRDRVGIFHGPRPSTASSGRRWNPERDLAQLEECSKVRERAAREAERIGPGVRHGTVERPSRAVLL
jgi:catechol 2,3-dioxygenase-like lactoylglutathione lyase family enzyme